MTTTFDLVRILLNFWEGDYQKAIDACNRIESHEERPDVATEYRLAAAHIARLKKKKARTKWSRQENE